MKGREPGMTAEGNAAAGRPVGRVRFMDAQRVNLDGFAVEDADLGLVAMRSPYDPEPGLVIRDGRVTETGRGARGPFRLHRRLHRQARA